MAPNQTGSTLRQERPQTYAFEAKRLASFRDWNFNVHKEDLAAAGFYSLGDGDKVKCAFCGVVIDKWEENDDPRRDHQRWSPSCPYIRGFQVGNVKIGQEALPIAPVESRRGYDVCGAFRAQEVRPNSAPERGSSEMCLEELGIHKMTSPAWPNYSTYISRLNSYEGWPLAIKQRPEKLSEAGFYYTGKGDQTICFHCGGGLKDWEDTDDPWVEHAVWFSKCPFVLLTKGKEFVDELTVKKKELTHNDTKDINLPAELQSAVKIVHNSNMSEESSECLQPAKEKPKDDSQRTIEDARLCKICYGEEMGVVFLPCGHIVACVECAQKLKSCVVCKKQIIATVRTYLS